MPIPLKISGLEGYIKDIPDGNIILVEGSIDPVKDYFVQYVGHVAKQNGRNVKYITSRPEEVKKQLLKYNSNSDEIRVIQERSARHWKDHIEEKSVLIINSFSYLMLEKNLYEFQHVVEELRTVCKQKDAVVLLALEDNMLEDKQEITVEYLADGIIRFLQKEASSGIARYLRLPKWMESKSFDQNIYYMFDGKTMNVDPRSRVT